MGGRERPVATVDPVVGALRLNGDDREAEGVRHPAQVPSENAKSGVPRAPYTEVGRSHGADGRHSARQVRPEQSHGPGLPLSGDWPV